MNKSLYNIQNEYLSIIQEIEELDGEFTEDQQNALEINESDLRLKSESYVGIIAKLESEIIMAKEMEKRAKEFAQRKQRVIDKLKGRLLDAVNLFGDQLVGVTEIKTRKSSVVTVVAPEKLDEKYTTKKLTITPDKKAIKDAIKAGEKVEGAIIEERKKLVIR